MTLLILVDGLRHDYLNPDDSPFLYFLAEEGISGCIRETFAFQLRPAFFAGLYPEECDIAHLYCYDPERSPFRELPPDLSDRRDISEFVRRKEAERGHTASQYYAGPAEIPFNFLPYFDFSEKYLTSDPGSLGENISLFDVLREHSKKWLWIGYPNADQRTSPLLGMFQKELKDDHSFVYLHFAELDWVGHQYGPHSQKQKRTLREIDEAIREIYETLRKRFSKVNGIIFGDHGQVKVKRTVDIESLLNQSDLEPEKDYLYFLDSTQARFWFFKEKAKGEVIRILNQIPYGKILQEEDYKRLRFRFEHNKFGELIFVVENNTMIFPNFFQREAPCKGMHGYLPEVEANWGKLIITGAGRKSRLRSPVEMTQIYPTLLEMLELPRPDSCKVKSVLSDGELFITERKPFLSVVIPTFNRRDILSKTLQGFIRQKCDKDEFEVVIVDDGSPDGTDRLVAEMIKNSSINMRYFRQGKRGPAAARNYGFKEATGEVILFTGDDCIPDESLIAEHIKSHKENPDVAVLGGVLWHPDIPISPFMRFIHIDFSPDPNQVPFLGYNHKGAQFNFLFDDLNDLSFDHFYTSNISIRKQRLIEAGGFDEDFKDAVFEDIELGYRLTRKGLRIVFNKNAITYHYHPIDLRSFAERQRRAGWGAVVFWEKHPELGQALGFEELINQDFMLRFFDSAVRYFYLAGILEAMDLKTPEDAPEDVKIENRFWETRLAKFYNKIIREKEAQYERLKKEVEQKDERMQKEIEQWARLASGLDEEIKKRDELIRILRAEVMRQRRLISNFERTNQLRCQKKYSESLKGKVFLLAIDGLDWQLISTFCQAGKLPNTQRLIAQGSWGELGFANINNIISPVIWTTIATGKHPQKHGITDFVDADGVIVTSNMIKVKRIWDILSDNDISCGVVGWFVTYPPTKVKGFMVSDLPHKKDGCYPKELYHLLPHPCIEDKLKQFSPFIFDKDYQKKYQKNSIGWIRNHLYLTRFKQVFFRDETVKQFGLRLFKEYRPEFMTLYLRGIDYVCHGFWRYMRPEDFKDISKLGYNNTSQEDIYLFGKIIENYYAYMDNIIGEVLNVIDDDSILMLISDHGFGRIKEEHILNKGPECAIFLSGSHYYDNKGVIIVSGNNIKKGKINNASVFDITPTVLNIFGLPVGKDMDGRVLKEIFKNPNKLKYINTYEKGYILEEKAIKTRENQEIIDRLKGLGYLS